MSTQTRSEAPQHIAFLDALRGLAAVAVVAVHTVQNFSGGFLTPLIGLGAAGVQLFYIVSAYSLCLSFAQRSGSEQRPVRKYLLRRFFRIAPLFWLAILIYLLRPFLLPEYAAPVNVHPPTWQLADWHVLATFFFVNGWHYQSINLVVPGGWSVAVESNFYLLLPIFFAFACNLRRALALVGITLVFAILSRVALYRMYGTADAAQAGEAFGIFAGLWLPAQLPVFALGIVMVYLVPRSSLVSSAVFSSRLLQPIGLCVAAWVLLTMAPTQWSSYLPQSFQAGLLLLGFSWLIAWWPHAVLVNPLMLFLGKVSYSLYLLHFIALHLVKWGSQALYEPFFGSAPGFGLAFPMVMVLATGLAWAGYRFVEVPGQSLGRRVINRV